MTHGGGAMQMRDTLSDADWQRFGLALEKARAVIEAERAVMWTSNVNHGGPDAGKVTDPEAKEIIARMDDALASCSAALGETVEHREIAWLIERDEWCGDRRTHYYWEPLGAGRFGWTPDPNQALRFPTKEAAEAVIGKASSDLHAREHVWIT